MIFVDSNVPMYLVGAAHPHKVDAQHLLERCIADPQLLVTDAEVLQEILHRYVALDRRDAIQPAFDALLGVVDEVFPMDLPPVKRAKALRSTWRGCGFLAEPLVSLYHGRQRRCRHESLCADQRPGWRDS